MVADALVTLGLRPKGKTTDLSLQYNNHENNEP